MKTRTIFTEEQYNTAKSAPEESVTFQNNVGNWVTFGTYGATIFFIVNKKICTKHVNYWKDYTYKSLVTKFDIMEIEL